MSRAQAPPARERLACRCDARWPRMLALRPDPCPPDERARGAGRPASLRSLLTLCLVPCRLSLAMLAGCVPVIIQPNVLMPLHDVLPYRRHRNLGGRFQRCYVRLHGA